LTLAGLMVCSAGWLQLLFRFCPAIRHWPGGAASDWPRALSAETNKSAAINAGFLNDASHFFLDIFFLLLVFDLAITPTWLLCYANACPSRTSPGTAAMRFVFNGKEKHRRTAAGRKSLWGRYLS